MGKLIPIYLSVSSGSTVSDYGLSFDDIMAIKRDGIGYKRAELDEIFYTQEATAYTFLWAATKPHSIPSGLYMVKTASSVQPFPTRRRETFDIGPTIEQDFRYTIQIGTVIVGYTTQAGDTRTDVLTGIMDAVNAGTFDTTVTASIVSDKLRIEMIGLSWDATPGYHYYDYYLYKSGRFVTWVGDYYLVSEAESNNSLPAIPAASDPYDWSELTYMPSGVGAWLAETGYTVTGYFPDSEGSVNIENVPIGDESTTLEGDTAYYGNGQIRFANDFSSEGEMILILYKT